MKKRVTVTIAVLVVIIISNVVAFVAGQIHATSRVYHRRYLEELKIIEPLISSNTAFARLELSEKSNGGVWITGQVATAEAWQELHSALRNLVGEERASEILNVSRPIND